MSTSTSRPPAGLSPGFDEITRDAVLLWRLHLRRDRRALDLLVQYNMADVVHLKSILALCYDRLVSAMADLGPVSERRPA